MLCRYCRKETYNFDRCPHCGLANTKGSHSKTRRNANKDDINYLKNFFNSYKKDINSIKRPIKISDNTIFFSKYGFIILILVLFLCIAMTIFIFSFINIVSN